MLARRGSHLCLATLALCIFVPGARALTAGQWTRLPITTGLHYHSIVLDNTRQRLIAFGGTHSGTNTNDVFVLPLAGPAVWQRIDPAPGPSPDARNAQSMIYDPVADRLIVFGGNTATGVRGDLWALSLGGSPAWTQLSPVGPAPIARWGHVAIFDPVRYRMIVFGGHADLDRLNDVWALSLAPNGGWTDITPAGPAPSPRWGSSGVYDPVGDQLVLFGGANLLTAYQDTWALSLSGVPAWSNLAPLGTPPSARWEHATAYDAARQRLLLFGGYNGTTQLADVWELSLDGTIAWNPLAPGGTAPSPRWATQWIADPARDRLVDFGGASATGDQDDVWALSLAGGPQWGSVLPSTHRPAPRYETPAAFDPAGQRMFIVGGFAFGAFLNDVWSLALTGNAAWTPIAPAGTPPAVRHSHTLTFDPVRDRLVLFGGVGDGPTYPRYNDVWALSLADPPTWAQLTPSGTPPPPIYGHTAIYDPVRDRLVVFGGVLTPGGYTQRVWALSLGASPAWTELAPTGGPPAPRANHSAIYDPARDRMVVYGGDDYTSGGEVVSDVWQLAFSPGEQWSQLSSAPTLYRGYHTAVYDAGGDRMIVFGGYDNGPTAQSSSWSYPLGNATGFAGLFPGGPFPTGRADHAAILDPDRHRMLVYGGFSASAPPDPDVWSLDLAPGSLEVPPTHPGLDLRLEAAYPDPAASDVTIGFSLPAAGEVSLRIYDLSGRLVRTMAEGRFPIGPSAVRWDRRTSEGAVARPGLYFYELRSGGTRLARRVALTE